MNAELILFKGPERARLSSVPVSDFQGLRGAFGCSCFAF